MYRTRAHTHSTVKVISPDGVTVAIGDPQYMNFLCQKLNDKLEVSVTPKHMEVKIPFNISKLMLDYIQRQVEGRVILILNPNGSQELKFEPKNG